MKKYKITYWSATIIVSVMMIFSAIQYLINPAMKDAFVHLGFPDYFRVELAIAKILGASVLLLPFMPAWLKQLTYAGFALTFVSAFISHLSVGDAFSFAFMPLIFLAVMAVSYFAWKRLSERPAAAFQ
jgi:hypothetical protein